LLSSTKKSNDDSGKCNIHPTGNRDDVVFGVLFNILDKEKPILDRVEGLGEGYSEKYVKIFLADDVEAEAFTYQALPSRISDSLKPYDWYKAYVVSGACDHQLPKYYVARLKNVLAVKDPNEDRAEKEWNFLKTKLNFK